MSRGRLATRQAPHGSDHGRGHRRRGDAVSRTLRVRLRRWPPL